LADVVTVVLAVGSLIALLRFRLNSARLVMAGAGVGLIANTFRVHHDEIRQAARLKNTFRKRGEKERRFGVLHQSAFADASDRPAKVLLLAV
jgi:hypothetical protein